jgi:hypothetical protein
LGVKSWFFTRNTSNSKVTCCRFSPVSSNNKTYCCDIAEILLKVALNTIILTLIISIHCRENVFPETVWSISLLHCIVCIHYTLYSYT